jgi:myosin heavy subunit
MYHPNPEKLPIKIDLLSTVQQLRCAGVVAAVTISRVSYPNRLTHQTALERFSCLFHDSPDESKSEENGDNLGSSIEQILSDFKEDNSADLFAIGKSRIYFRAGALEFLELQRMKKLGELATAIQTCARGFLAISAFHALRNKCIFIQSLARRNKARKELLQACAAVTLLACWIRQINGRRELEALRREKASTLIQNRYRIMSARMVLCNSLCGAIYIQKIWRGALQRPKYPIMLAEAKEEARVNSKIAALQKRLADAEMKLIRADKERVLYENGGRVDPQPIESSEEKKDDREDDRNQSLIHESTEMIESLRKENFQLKTSSYLLKSDLNSLKSSYGELSEHYASLQHSFNALKKHSANLSNTTMKSNVSALLHKKDIGNAKKAMKQQKQEHKTDIAKLKSLMKAKDLDNESEIARLQALVESLSKNKRHSSHRRSSKSTIEIDSSRHSDRNRGSKNLRVNTKTRAKFTDDDSPRNQYAQITPGSDKWGNEGFFTMHGKEKSPTNSLNSGRNSIPRHRNSRTKKKNNRSVSTSSAVPNQITTITRELSTSSLQGALKKSTQSTSKVAPSTKNISPRSSLSSAVSKQSSLAQRAGNNKQ